MEALSTIDCMRAPMPVDIVGMIGLTLLPFSIVDSLAMYSWFREFARWPFGSFAISTLIFLYYLSLSICLLIWFNRSKN